MAVTFEQVTDVEGAARWHALEERCVPLDHPGLLADPLLEVEEMVTGEHRTERPVLFVARDGAHDVGNALVWLPLLDNLENASVFLSVDHDHRRRGIGARFVQFVIEFARGEGRRRAIFFTRAPLDGSDEPGSVLARALGAELAFVVDDGARLMARMSTDAPMGELAWEPEVWDAARYREKEAEAMARRRRRIAAGAVERATGRLVAYTDIGVSQIEPRLAYQWDTIVDPEHRGHRLGLLVKIANLRQLRACSPATLRMQTWNAEANEHMVAINDVLGFRPVEYSRQYQLAI